MIDYKVPKGDAGTWTIEVTSGDQPKVNTACWPPERPERCRSSWSPAPIPPREPFSNRPRISSLPSMLRFWVRRSTPDELEVNGVAATAVTLVNANTVDWTVPLSAYPTGADLSNTVTIGTDCDGNQVTDVSGQTLTPNPFSYKFDTTNIPPTVVKSSIDGKVFSPAPASVTEVVTFSQPMNTSFTTSSSFNLVGNFRNVNYAAASFTWNPTAKS